jgi:hypothetical protein
MKTKNPYGANYDVLVPPATIQKEQSQAGGKAKARYPNPPLGPGQSNGEAGKMKRPAYTPGGPSGS